MSAACATPWVTNPYVFWRHPVARIAAVMLLVLLDICVYGTDPIHESRVEGNIPGVGTIFAFLFRFPSNGGRVLSRLGLIFLSCSAGLYAGRQFLHHRVFRDTCALTMCVGSGGSFLLMGLGVAGACLAGAAIYNWIIPNGSARVTGAVGMEARAFGKILQISSAVAHTVAAVQVTDGVLQDRQRYPKWASGLKRHWRQSLGGWLRIICAWALAAALASAFVWGIAAATWGSLNEIARVFFTSVLMFFDLFVVVQDWEFPTLQPHPDLDRPILIAGSFRPHIHCGAGSQLLRHSQTRRSGSLLPSPSGISRSGADKFFNVRISGPWLSYGPLFCAVFLDFLAMVLHMRYTPQDYGQYIDPSNRIWTIVDNAYLLRAYESGIVQQPALVTWAARRDVSTGLPSSASAVSDVLSSASWAGGTQFWKFAAAIPGVVMLLAFLPLTIISDRLGSRPNGRPPLCTAEPEPVFVPAARVCPLVDEEKQTQEQPDHDRAVAAALREGFELTAPPPPLPPPAPAEDTVASLCPLDDTGGCLAVAALEHEQPPSPPLVRPQPLQDSVEPATKMHLASAVVDSPRRLVEKEAGGQRAPLAVVVPPPLVLSLPLEDAVEPAEKEMALPLEDGVESATAIPLGSIAVATPLRPGTKEAPKRQLSVRFADEEEASKSNTPVTISTVATEASQTSGPDSQSRTATLAKSTSQAGLQTPPGFGATPKGFGNKQAQASAFFRRPSSKELQLRARSRQKLLRKLAEVDHFDVLLRKRGKPLGLTFKLPEVVCSKVRSTQVQEAIIKGHELRVPDGAEPLDFGRYKGMPMREVAINFPRFCKAMLQEEQDSVDPSPDLLRFVMYLRMTHPEFKNEELQTAEEMATHDAKEARTLLVVDVVDQSAVDVYNRAQAATGNWNRVVLPGMHISAVNGIRRDPLAMANALCRTEVATIRFLYLRNTEVTSESALQVTDKTQRLMEERISKLMRMEGEEIANSMRTQADWEAMAASLASALVKEVYKGDRLVHRPPAIPHAVILPEGAPPALCLAPAQLALSNGSSEIRLTGAQLLELSDSEESV